MKVFCSLILLLSITASGLCKDTLKFVIPNPGATIAHDQNPPIGSVRLILDIERTIGWNAPNQGKVDYAQNDDPAAGFYNTIAFPKIIKTNEYYNTFGSVTETLKLSCIVEKVAGKVKRFELVFDLATNTTNDFKNNMSADETWTIEIYNNKNFIAGTIHTMYVDENGLEHYLNGNEGFSTQQAYFLDDTGNKVEWFGAYENIRPPIALGLTLDISNSMNQESGIGTTTRIEQLFDAIEDLIYIWKEPEVPVQGDKIGVVLFNTQAEWWTGLPQGLNDSITSVDLIADGDIGTKNDPFRSIQASGWTSMGDGILKAAGAFSSTGAERNVILVVSDGEQNTEPMIGVSNTGRLYTHPENDPTYNASLDIPNQDEFQIYSITTAPSGSAWVGWVNQQIAQAGKGFHLYSGASSNKIRLFFLEMLQNFLRFHTIEISHIIDGVCKKNETREMEFDVAGGTKWFVYSLLFNRAAGVMRVTLIPPGNGRPIVAEGRGAIHVRPNLKEIAPLRSFAGRWKATVEVLETQNVNEIPYQVMVIEDNMALSSTFEVVTSKIKPGDYISVTAGARILGQAVSGLGGNAGEDVSVLLTKSDISIGDYLSKSKASTQPLTPNDSLGKVNSSLAMATAKLANAFNDDPGFMTFLERRFKLKDNGSGVYETKLPTDVEGTYTMLFTIKGNDPCIGPYMRQQIRTVHVLPYPDSQETMVKLSKTGNVLNLNFTPKTRLGHRMGPGWANRLWLKASDGRITKPKDNGDGTYTAAFDMKDGKAPSVDLFFVDAPVIIADETPTDKLPVPLDGNSLLIQDVASNGQDDNGGIPIWMLLVIVFVAVGVIFIKLNKPK